MSPKEILSTGHPLASIFQMNMITNFSLVLSATSSPEGLLLLPTLFCWTGAQPMLVLPDHPLQ